MLSADDKKLLMEVTTILHTYALQQGDAHAADCAFDLREWIRFLPAKPRLRHKQPRPMTPAEKRLLHRILSATRISKKMQFDTYAILMRTAEAPLTTPINKS